MDIDRYTHTRMHISIIIDMRHWYNFMFIGGDIHARNHKAIGTHTHIYIIPGGGGIS